MIADRQHQNTCKNISAEDGQNADKDKLTAVFRNFQFMQSIARNTDNKQSAPCRAQTFVAFPFEIIIPRQIEKVYLNPFPLQVRVRSVDRHLFCAFKVVVVADGIAIGDFPLSVDSACGKQHGFKQGGFPFAAVTDDGDVADVFAGNTHTNSPYP